MSACMVCTIGFSFHGTQVKMKPSQYEVTLQIRNKVVCDNVYASGMCVIMAEDKLLLNELLMTDFMLYNA